MIMMVIVIIVVCWYVFYTIGLIQGNLDICLHISSYLMVINVDLVNEHTVAIEGGEHPRSNNFRSERPVLKIYCHVDLVHLKWVWQQKAII